MKRNREEFENGVDFEDTKNIRKIQKTEEPQKLRKKILIKRKREEKCTNEIDETDKLKKKRIEDDTYIEYLKEIDKKIERIKLFHEMMYL